MYKILINYSPYKCEDADVEGVVYALLKLKAFNEVDTVPIEFTKLIPGKPLPAEDEDIPF